MNKKEREEYKRNKIRNLYVYAHKNMRDIMNTLNSDPEYIRKCGKIAYNTVAYWVNRKIKPELENAIDSDALETFNAEFTRSIEFIDGEISDITKILEENEDMKPDDRLKYINMRHRMEIDKMTLLADRALPLAVKKWKTERTRHYGTIKKVDEEIIPAIVFKDRVRPKNLNEVTEKLQDKSKELDNG